MAWDAKGRSRPSIDASGTGKTEGEEGQRRGTGIEASVVRQVETLEKRRRQRCRKRQISFGKRAFPNDWPSNEGSSRVKRGNKSQIERQS